MPRITKAMLEEENKLLRRTNDNQLNYIKFQHEKIEWYKKNSNNGIYSENSIALSSAITALSHTITDLKRRH